MSVTLNYQVKHINKNKFSRPVYKLLALEAIVIHYTANHGGTSDNHFNYFNNLNGRYASAHIFVDKLKTLEIIPLNEVAFHANERKAGSLISSLNASASYYKGGNANLNTIGIEMCMEKDGTIHPDTIQRTILAVQKLQKQFGVLPIYRHFDITGKRCPLPFVANEKLWTKFLADVRVIDELQKEATRMFSPSSPTLKAAFEQYLSDAVKADYINDKWLTDFKVGKLSLDDAIALNVIVYQRKK